MLVKDLIYLLKTRAKPDMEIEFKAFVTFPDKVAELNGYTYDLGFNTVTTDLNNDRDDMAYVCYITIPDCLVQGIRSVKDEPCQDCQNE
jgi:hypothetical protein